MKRLSDRSDGNCCRVPRRLGFSQHGAIGAIANMAGFVTFVR